VLYKFSRELEESAMKVSSLFMRARGLVFAGMLTACAATAPDIRVDYDRSVDVSAYRTFGFPEETGTDRGGYSTLITQHFKSAVQRQMTARGYVHTQGDPQLLVNFYANVRERTASRPSTMISYGYGYYRYRFGLYQTWPLYTSVDTVTYRVGTVNIDVVDAAKKQLVWEGVAEGQIRDADMKNPQAAIERVVGQVLSRFPPHSNM
jgi:hypothetical protein